MEDDVLSALDEDDKPFASAEDNRSYKNNPKRENLWNKIDFTPTTVDTSKLSMSGKSYAWYNFSPNGIPDNILNNILSVCKSLSKKGFIYRHNGSASDVIPNKILKIEDINFESYLPWSKFNSELDKDKVKLQFPNLEAYNIACAYHSKFTTLPASVRAILASTVNSLFGKNVTDPVNFVLCYTECGTEALSKKVDYKKLGNLSFILRIAADANIPVFNFKNDKVISNLKEYLS